MYFLFFLSKGNAPSDDIEKEMARLRQINKDFQIREQEYDNLYEQHTKTQLDLQLKHQALDAFKETITVFEEQMELHKRFHGEAAQHEIPRYKPALTVYTSHALGQNIHKVLFLDHSLLSPVVSMSCYDINL